MRKFPNSSKTWTVEHTYENEAYLPDPISTVEQNIEAPKDFESVFKETAKNKKQRRISHYVVYTTTMIMTVGFSVILSGVWPYLQALDKDLTKESLGWVVAANPLGQMIASPFLGYLGNRMGSIRYVCYFTMLMFISGNILYAVLPSFTDLWQHSAFHIMIFARFVVGISSANISLCRSYLAASTTNKERTTGITIISASQATGFILGPTIQTILSLIIKDEFLQYRTAGWVAAALGVLNFILLTPAVFKEFSVAAQERDFIKNYQSQEERLIIPGVDYLAITGIIFAFFVNTFIYVLLETLIEPFMTDQYSWCDELAVVVVGAIFALGGIAGVFMFIAATKLAKIFQERSILLFCGFLPATMGVFLFLPWGPDTLNYCDSPNKTTLFSDGSINTAFNLNNYSTNDSHWKFTKSSFDHTKLAGIDFNTDKWCDPNQCLGCPSEQTWCEGYKKLPFIQFIIAYSTVFIGYPFSLSMCSSIYSKLLGPKPQGTFMGVLTAAGSFSRVLGPVFVSIVYATSGTIMTFGIILLCMLLAFSELCLLYKRLVPMKIKKVRLSDVGKI